MSYGTQPFFGVNALKFTNAQGVSKFGRYRIVPDSGPAYVSDDEAAKRPPTALADNLRASLEKGPVIPGPRRLPAACHGVGGEPHRTWRRARAAGVHGASYGGSLVGYGGGTG